MDFAMTCWHGLPSKVDGEGRQISPEEAAIDFIATWICDPNEGSLMKLCKEYSLNWGVLWAWIRKDAGRNQMYQEAMLARGQLRKEWLIDEWKTTAVMKPADDVSHGDVHKAREALAKAEGVFSDANKVQVDTQITIVHESV